MKREKAYKVLALQEKISNSEAKKLIDRGVVYLKGKLVKIARAEVPINSKFRIRRIEKPKKIFEDERILVVDKPSFLDSDEVAKRFGRDIFLLHRLDRGTSGVLLLGKDREFQKTIIDEFKQKRVYKEYIAWVSGRIAEPVTISKRLKKIRRGNEVRTIISKDGLEAVTHIEPLAMVGKKTKVKITIENGRTHQIRVHLSHLGYPIVGDGLYGGVDFERLLLHAKKIELLNYSFEVEEPPIFNHWLK